MPEGVKQRSVRGSVVHQDARYERANITLAYGFCSQALVGDNQKISIEKMLIYSILHWKKCFKYRFFH